jgi:hypothetical protein
MNNLPAFPTGIVTDDKGKIIGGSNGMSLRDYFAAAALSGMYANPDHSYNTHFVGAAEAYAMADAMLKAREK